MKAVVAAFNQEKALVGAFSVITNLRMELFQALVCTRGVAAARQTRVEGTRVHAPAHLVTVGEGPPLLEAVSRQRGVHTHHGRLQHGHGQADINSLSYQIHSSEACMHKKLNK